MFIFQQHILQAVETAGIKFPDYKNSGVSLRSQRMKLPANVGQKKAKGIEQILQEMNLGRARFAVICFINNTFVSIRIKSHSNRGNLSKFQ